MVVLLKLVMMIVSRGWCVNGVQMTVSVVDVAGHFVGRRQRTGDHLRRISMVGNDDVQSVLVLVLVVTVQWRSKVGAGQIHGTVVRTVRWWMAPVISVQATAQFRQARPIAFHVR